MAIFLTKSLHLRVTFSLVMRCCTITSVIRSLKAYLQYGGGGGEREGGGEGGRESERERGRGEGGRAREREREREGRE